jgi:hypothetical protein
MNEPAPMQGRAQHQLSADLAVFGLIVVIGFAIACTPSPPVAPTVAPSVSASSPGPFDLGGAYRLTIDATGKTCPMPALVKYSFQFDGTLTRDGQTRAFSTLPWREPYSGSTFDLHLQLTAAGGDAVSGSFIVDGAQPSNLHDIRTAWGLWVYVNASTDMSYSAAPVQALGTVAADGTITETFTGHVVLVNEVTASRCTGTFPWTLTPL